MHLHVHLIPRYAGDVPDPRGIVAGSHYALASQTQDAMMILPRCSPLTAEAICSAPRG